MRVMGWRSTAPRCSRFGRPWWRSGSASSVTKRCRLGRAVAGLNAYSKGKSLELFSPTPEDVRQKRKAAREREGFSVDLLQRAVPVTRTADGLRALSKDKPIEPASVRKYLQSKFGDALDDETEAMRTLAGSLGADDLAHHGFRLNKEFRPDVPAGTKGWGTRGRLDLD